MHERNIFCTSEGTRILFYKFNFSTRCLLLFSCYFDSVAICREIIGSFRFFFVRDQNAAYQSRLKNE